MNYCAVTQDFNTYHIEEEALRILESFGFSRQLVIDSLNQGELNHATCSYNLLVMEWIILTQISYNLNHNILNIYY